MRPSSGAAGDSLGTGAVMGLLRLDGGRCGAEPTLRSQYRRKWPTA